MSRAKTVPENYSQLARSYLLRHPALRVALDLGVLNYSALSRLISRDKNIANRPALSVACQRLRRSGSVYSGNDKVIQKLVKTAQIDVRSPIAVAHISKAASSLSRNDLLSNISEHPAILNIIEGDTALTLICDERLLDWFQKTPQLKLADLSRGLARVSMHFSKLLENTPGVVGYVCTLLSAEGLNIREQTSCYTELTLVVDQADVGHVLQVLS